jgi:hypothetical protein
VGKNNGNKKPAKPPGKPPKPTGKPPDTTVPPPPPPGSIPPVTDPNTQPVPDLNAIPAGLQRLLDAYGNPTPQGQPNGNGPVAASGPYSRNFATAGATAGGSGGGGGAAGGADSDLVAQTRTVDPKYQQQLEDLQNEIAQNQGKLANLTPDEQALLASQKQAAVAAANQSADDERNQLLTRAFAGGNQQSTIFGDVASRAVSRQSAVMAGIEGDSASRELALREQLSQDAMQGRSLRAQIGSDRLHAGIEETGLYAQQDASNNDRLAGLRQARISADAQMAAASASAGASLEAARLGAQTDRFKALVGLYSDQQHIQEQQREYGGTLAENQRQFDASNAVDRGHLAVDRLNSDRNYALGRANIGVERDRLSLDRLQSDRNYDLGQRQISVQRFGITSENNRFEENLAYDQTRDSNNLGEQQREFDWGQYNTDRRFNLDTDALQRGAYQYQQQRNDQQTATWVGLIGGIIGAFSDRNLKDNIEPINNALDKLRRVDPVQWTWKASGKPSAGVIAQDFEQIIPEAVTYRDGKAFVDYGFVLALLVGAVQELAQSLEVSN